MDPTRDGPATWVERASRGDAAAVALLLERHLPGLRAWLRLRAGRILLAKESSSDLAQSVCREILEHAGRFQYAGEAQFRKWLYTTALRKIAHRYEHFDAAKRRAPRAGTRDPELLEACATLLTPSRDAIAREELARTADAFEKLSDEHREVILLSRLVGLSAREIGEEMGRSEAAVRQLLRRALADLAVRAKPGGDPPDAGR